jgi:dTDP-4-dehydrorhamnose 3,5-epimerase
MKITPLGIEGAWLVESQVRNDDRGFFIEWFKGSSILEATGESFVPMQANISKSAKHVFRGIHYSLAPEGQAKLVTVMSGSIIDFIIDIRIDSPTFGRYISVPIDCSLGTSVLLSPTLGHGFLSLSDNTVVSYLVSSEYQPHFEHALNPFSIPLNLSDYSDTENAILSEKDLQAPSIDELLNKNLLPSFTHHMNPQLSPKGLK